MRTCTSFFWLTLACVIAGLLFVTGLIPAAKMPVAYVLLPLGAVFAGMGLVWRALERESQANDPAHDSATAQPTDSGHDCGCGNCGCGAGESH